MKTHEFSTLIYYTSCAGFGILLGSTYSAFMGVWNMFAGIATIGLMLVLGAILLSLN